MKLSLITDPHSRCFSTTLSTLISGNPHPIKFPSSFPLKKVSYSFPLTICLSKSLSTVDSQTHNQAPHGQIKSTEEIESLHVEVGSPKILPSLLLSTKFSLTDQAFFLLAFIACTTSVAFTSLVVAAVPTLFSAEGPIDLKG